MKKGVKIIKSNIVSIEKQIIFELNVDEYIEKIQPKFEITFRFASKKDIADLDKAIYGYDDEGKRYSLERMNKGDKCFLAENNRTIVGYVWLMNGEMELSMGRNISLPKSKAFIYKGFVLDEFRGKRVLNAIDLEIIGELKKSGRKCLITAVGESNQSSIKARKRIGFKKIGKIIQFKCLSFRYNYISKKDFLYLQT